MPKRSFPSQIRAVLRDLTLEQARQLQRELETVICYLEQTTGITESDSKGSRSHLIAVLA